MVGPGPGDYNLKGVFDIDYDFKIIDKIIGRTSVT